MKLKKVMKLFVLILIILTLFNNICVLASEISDKDLEEKFKLLEEAKKEYEQELIKDAGTWRGKKYTYAFGYLSGMMDENEKICYSVFSGNLGIDYNNYAKMQDYVRKYVGEYFEEYKKSNDEDKLKEYFLGNTSIYTREYEYNEMDDIEARINIFFVPESNKSKWRKNAQKAYTKVYHKARNEFVEIDGYDTAVYIRLVWENDKYVVKFIDNKPEGYDEFVARMKEHGIDVENIDYAKLINANADIKEEIQAAEKKEFEAKQITIGSIKKGIIAVCGSLILLIVLINIFINKKSKRKI